MAEGLQWQFDSAMERAQDLFGKIPIEIIKPKVENLEARHPIDNGKTAKIALLPKVEIRGFFYSFSPARDKQKHASRLVIIWYQDAWVGALSPEVEEKVTAMDWDKLAEDFEW